MKDSVSHGARVPSGGRPPSRHSEERKTSEAADEVLVVAGAFGRAEAADEVPLGKLWALSLSKRLVADGAFGRADLFRHLTPRL